MQLPSWRTFFKFYAAFVFVAVCINLAQYSSRQYTPANDGLVRSFKMIETTSCTLDSQCGNGQCIGKPEICVCNSGFISVDGVCNYEQKSKLVAFLLSFLIGGTGADWFYLYRDGGSGGYIAAGVFKLLTLGGFGIW